MIKSATLWAHTAITKVNQLQTKGLIVIQDYIQEIGEVVGLKYLCDDDNTRLMLP